MQPCYAFFAAKLTEIICKKDWFSRSSQVTQQIIRFSSSSLLTIIFSTEAPLNFRPTYKFDVGSTVYDSGPKKRIPSWTDRILFVDSPNVSCLAYNSDETVTTSDHRPVYASFLIGFSAFVQLDESQNAVVANQSAIKFTSESQVCSIS